MPKNMSVPLAVLLVVLGVSTYLQGNFSERWGRSSSQRLLRLAENVNTAVPLQVGNWTGQEQPVDDEQFIASNCEAARDIRYEETTTGQVVNAFVVAGNARNVTIHTPDQCYVGAGFEMEGEKHTYTHTIDLHDGQPPQTVEFVTATFRKEEPERITRLQILWTFSDDGQWRGPKVEKVSLAGKKYMAKVYFIHQIALSAPDELTGSPMLRLADELLPELNKSLFANLDEPPTGAGPPKRPAMPGKGSNSDSKSAEEVPTAL
ncbi:MAG: exosortase-associated EpsI family protein [Pirellulales bacterium]